MKVSEKLAALREKHKEYRDNKDIARIASEIGGSVVSANSVQMAFNKKRMSGPDYIIEAATTFYNEREKMRKKINRSVTSNKRARKSFIESLSNIELAQ